MARIKHAAYNKARAILMSAGSMTASKSHPKHGGSGDSPEGHGRSLLNEASQEWGGQVTAAQTTALTKAASEMDIDWP